MKHGLYIRSTFMLQNMSPPLLCCNISLCQKAEHLNKSNVMCTKTGYKLLKCTCEGAICIVQLYIQLNSKTCLLHKNIWGFHQKHFCVWLLKDKKVV